MPDGPTSGGICLRHLGCGHVWPFCLCPSRAFSVPRRLVSLSFGATKWRDIGELVRTPTSMYGRHQKFQSERHFPSHSDTTVNLMVTQLFFTESVHARIERNTQCHMW